MTIAHTTHAALIAAGNQAAAALEAIEHELLREYPRALAGPAFHALRQQIADARIALNAALAGATP